ncbi:MAG: SIS domain-containing protein [Actinomycetota bacterium]|nr:SIS domain-containing protein [Actinomycetota bacterium]
MCGIIAVLRRRSSRPVPDVSEIVAALDVAVTALDGVTEPHAGDHDLEGTLEAVRAPLVEVDTLLRGAPGVSALLADRGLAGAAATRLERIADGVGRLEAEFDRRAARTGGVGLESINAAFVRCRDALWAVQQDRLRTAREVDALAGPAPSMSAIEVYLSIQEALSALDRLEVRGRDSAGLHVLVIDHGLDLDSPTVAALLEERTADDLFGTCSVRVTPEGHLSFVYKAAAEIGELGDNTASMRRDLRNDDLLRRAVAADTARAVVTGHTRWASVGIISQANAHPLNAEEIDQRGGPYVTAALNGDVDNFADLKAAHGLRIRSEITTDAKVIPTLVSRRLAGGAELVEAFRETVATLEGSVAITANAAADGETLLCALRGSGQALYIGLAEDSTIVASEPYGVVETAGRYLRMDGETPGNLDNPTASRGQVIALDARTAGDLASIRRVAYDGTELAVREDELLVPQITTRDIDRGTAPHYLLKEISEAPSSFRKTLRGKLVGVDDDLRVELPAGTLPDDVRAALADGSVNHVSVIGQGTAAVAGQSLAAALTAAVGPRRLRVEALPATELSGFTLRHDMSDTLVIAISQSGTTTDTNRTVDLVRARGARVISIVNRRGSDLVDKSDGVLYTSDGRDVEMSVASTKAFYSQIAAGFLLAMAIADIVGADGSAEADTAEERQAVLTALRTLPDAMVEVLGTRGEIADAARTHAPSRRYWALVGNGTNRIAAQELRIKLSELCYKSIACDATEDKKHIDLSSEPLILVCAAGLTGSTADDVAKEVGIYRAHRAAPIVIATRGEERFTAALARLTVPETHPRLAFVLATMVGHLFGYEAALAIDSLAVPLREARAAVESATTRVAADGDPDDLLRQLRPAFEPVTARFHDGLRSGNYDGHLEANTAVRVASLLRYATGVFPLGAYQLEYGKVGTPSVVVEDLTRALTDAIDQLTRPVDAIKHQAKTVTVGISRSEEGLLQVPLVHSVLTAGAARDRLSYETLRTLAALDPLVDEVTGWTRYRIEGRVDDGGATISVVDRGGIALDLPLRTERSPQLRGSKHRVATERAVLVTRGYDGRLLVIVPEVKDAQVVGITLLHVRFADDLAVPTLRSALSGYRKRYTSLVDAVTETEPSFRDDLLAAQPTADLFVEPVPLLAQRWRA